MIDDVKGAEGLRTSAYQDSVGVWTIGYGTNLQELTISEAQAETWLVKKLEQAEDECWRFSWFAGLNAVRQRAIVELIYNLGLTRFRGFTRMLAALVRRDYVTAAAELLDSTWAGQVGPTRAHRLAEMIRTGM